MSIQQIQNADEMSAHRMIVLPSQGGVRCTEYHYTLAEGALFTVCFMLEQPVPHKNAFPLQTKTTRN